MNSPVNCEREFNQARVLALRISGIKRVTKATQFGWRRFLGIALLGVYGALTMFSGRTLKAQTVTSSLDGTVTDSSGAAMPTAEISLKDLSTGVVLNTKSDGTGHFAFPSIPAGTYQLTVSQKGFAPYVLSDFKVAVAQHLSESVVLKVGTVVQTVTVKGGGLEQLLQKGSNDLGNLISPESVTQLPLNGRNFLQLGLISGAVQLPGAGQTNNMAEQYQGAGRSDLTINISGNENDFTMYLIDGMQTVASRAGNSALGISLGAVNEFQVHYGFFLPDLGPDPGVVDVVTKSGTNKYHGEAYEYVRNNAWDARNFFSPTAPGPFHRNQFGGDVGGPIRKDKVFFFGNYEGFRQVLSAFQGAFAPTAAMFKGNFSALGTPIYNPFTYDPSTGQRQQFDYGGVPNQIDPNLINPVAQKLLQYYIPGSSYSERPNNVTGNPRSTLNDDQFNVRVDENISERNRLFTEFSYENSPATSEGLFPFTGTSYPINTELAALGWTSTLSASIVNELRVGWVRNSTYELGQVSPNIQSGLGITGTADPNGVPGMHFTGIGSLGTSLGRLGDIDNSYQLHDSVSWLYGAHLIKFGADLNYIRSIQESSNANARGSFTFSGNYTAQLTVNGQGQAEPVANTGNSFADFLLGFPTTGLTVSMPRTHYRWTNFSPYVQDSWKVRQGLTVNAGLGYFLSTPPNPQGADKNYPHSFDFTTGHITYAALGQINPEVYSMTLDNFEPRLGFAWNPGFSRNTVVRAGAGIYAAQPFFFYSQFSIVGPGVTVTQSITNPQPNPTYSLGSNVLPPLTLQPITQQFADNASGTLFYVPPTMPAPYVGQWTFDIQHTFGPHYLLDVGYIGNSGVHLLDEWNQNDCYLPSTMQCSRPLPYPQYPYILEAGNSGHSNYQGLVVKFRRQFSNGLSVLANYTYSKAITLGNEGGNGTLNQMGTCRQCDRGLALYDVPQSLVLSTVWNLPVGRGARFMSNMNPYANAAIGGWGLDFITTFQKGNPFTVTAPNNTSYSFRNVRPNRVCDGRNELGNKSLRSNGLYWIDTSCFVLPPPGYLGNSGQAILIGPGINNWDVGVHKDFPIHESARLQFRTEFFNAFNHAQFANPDGGITDVNFGKVTSTQIDAREIQFALRLVF